METKFKPNEVGQNECTCPLCGSQELEYSDDFDAEVNVVYNYVSCIDCDASWRVVYKMIAFDDLRDKDGNIVSNENW